MQTRAIKKGDKLYSAARKYNATVNEIFLNKILIMVNFMLEKMYGTPIINFN